MEVADVQFSLSKQDKHKALYKLQEFSDTIETIQKKLAGNEYGPADQFAKTKELGTLLEKSERFEDRYTKACQLEEEYAFNVPAAPRVR